MFLFPEISRNVSGNFWKPFPAVSRNIFPEISRKVQFEKKSKGFSLRNFCLKRMRVLTLQYNESWKRDQGTKLPLPRENFVLSVPARVLAVPSLAAGSAGTFSCRHCRHLQRANTVNTFTWRHR